VYKCHRAVGPVIIDGLLDEADWQISRAVQLVDLFGNPPLQPTTVRAMSLGDMLYVGFEVWDREIWATMAQRDDKVWMEEAVEFFISPPHLYPRAYYEFQISPRNVVRDIAVTWGSDGQRSLNADWDCHGLETAVHLEERGEWKVWTCEVALPMLSLSGGVCNACEDGQDWMINFFRIDRRPRLEYSCWSPTFEPNFHLPERFGRLLL
jgi:hypothetical protein